MHFYITKKKLFDKGRGQHELGLINRKWFQLRQEHLREEKCEFLPLLISYIQPMMCTLKSIYMASLIFHKGALLLGRTIFESYKESLQIID